MRKKSCEKRFSAIAALLLAAALVILPAADYLHACRVVRGGVIRLHVLADSDDPAAQKVKLKVRDALLQNAAELFDGSDTVEQARNRIGAKLDDLTLTANAVLRQEGVAYRAKAELTYEYFDTRAYEDFTLPAGNYAALKVVLGSGKGHNWWCVLFPPLCLPAAQGEDSACVFNEDELKVIRPAKGYRIRFKLAELAAELAEKWKNRSR